MDGITPTYNIGGSNDGLGFGGSGLWLFAILALMWGGNGFFGGNMQNCCCSIQRNIDSVNFNAAMNTASLKEAILLEGQKTRDLITENKMEALQARINQLELNQAVAGVVRYPSATTYTSGSNPFCNCGFNGNI